MRLGSKPRHLQVESQEQEDIWPFSFNEIDFVSIELLITMLPNECPAIPANYFRKPFKIEIGLVRVLNFINVSCSKLQITVDLFYMLVTKCCV